MRKTNSTALTFIKYFFLLSGIIFSVTPFIWMLSTAFKTKQELNVWPPALFPKHLGFENFVSVFKAAPFHIYFFNSLFIAAVSTGTIVLTSVLAGYIFAKFSFKGKNFLFSLILATAIVPFEIYMLQLYLQMQSLNLIDTYLGLLAPFLLMSFGIYFMRQNITQSIPDEVLEASRVEGASEWGIFIRIIVPLCKTPMSALAIFAFLDGWNAFVWPLLAANRQKLFTMELGLAMFQSAFSINLSVVSAGSLISVVPIFIVFVFLRKKIIQSISITGMK